jgi:hypothetical protein
MAGLARGGPCSVTNRPAEPLKKLATGARAASLASARSSSSSRRDAAPAAAPSQRRRQRLLAVGDGSRASEPAGDDGAPEPPRPIREQLARYGLGAFAAYGILSNLNAGVLICVSWLGVVRNLGVTPLDAAHPQAAGYFAASYAALYVTSNLLRPVRLSLAVAAAPFFNRLLDALQRGLRLPRPAAFAAVLVMIATGTLAGVAAALAALGGFPQGVPDVAGLGELVRGLKAAKQQGGA